MTVGQAAVGHRAGDPLSARPVPRQRRRPPRLARATSWASSRSRTRCTAWWTSGPTGEASASLGFAAARLFDELDPLEKRKRILRWPGEASTAARLPSRRVRKQLQKQALEFLDLKRQPASMRDAARYEQLSEDPLVKYVAARFAWPTSSVPASKLWNTGHGANMMREAVSLMGGYGITEDCPGFLGHKWMDCAARSHLRRAGSGAAPPAHASP